MKSIYVPADNSWNDIIKQITNAFVAGQKEEEAKSDAQKLLGYLAQEYQGRIEPTLMPLRTAAEGAAANATDAIGNTMVASENASQTMRSENGAEGLMPSSFITKDALATTKSSPEAQAASSAYAAARDQFNADLAAKKDTSQSFANMVATQKAMNGLTMAKAAPNQTAEQTAGMVGNTALLRAAEEPLMAKMQTADAKLNQAAYNPYKNLMQFAAQNKIKNLAPFINVASQNAAALDAQRTKDAAKTEKQNTLLTILDEKDPVQQRRKAILAGVDPKLFADGASYTIQRGIVFRKDKNGYTPVQNFQDMMGYNKVGGRGGSGGGGGSGGAGGGGAASASGLGDPAEIKKLQAYISSNVVKRAMGEVPVYEEGVNGGKATDTGKPKKQIDAVKALRIINEDPAVKKALTGYAINAKITPEELQEIIMYQLNGGDPYNVTDEHEF